MRQLRVIRDSLVVPGRGRPDENGGRPRIVVLEMSWAHMRNYNYLVVDPDSREAVIIDPAWQMEKLEQALLNTGAKLSGVLLTHAHFDHIHLAKAVAKQYDCPIWMSKEEIATSSFKTSRLVGFGREPWSIGRMRIEPIWAPGHTTGSVCYLIGDGAFTGDVLFAEGCGQCLDTEAAYAMFGSLNLLKERLAPETRIFPGHSYEKPPGQRFSQLLDDNIYLHFPDRQSFAAYRLRSGWDASKVFSFR